jgi:hypothetical protein
MAKKSARNNCRNGMLRPSTFSHRLIAHSGDAFNFTPGESKGMRRRRHNQGQCSNPLYNIAAPKRTNLIQHTPDKVRDEPIGPLDPGKRSSRKQPEQLWR